MSRGLSASLTWMAVIPGARLVRVSLRRDLGSHDAVAMLAHELRHVVELLDHPEVRSETALGDLYRRIGHASTFAARHWDTTAALRAGQAGAAGTARLSASRATGRPVQPRSRARYSCRSDLATALACARSTIRSRTS